MLTRFMLGVAAICTDGPCGQVSRVVVEQATMTLTHLVVEPADPEQLGRLVPLDLIDLTQDQLRLRCTLPEFYELAHAEKAQFVRGTGDYARYDQGQRVRPYFAQQRSRPGAGVNGRLPQTFTYDILPAGHIAVRAGDPVHAIDGDTGHITGVVADAGSHRVAYLLLQTGHLLGRKNIAVPVRAVARMDAGIRLDITRQEVKRLPPVSLHHQDH
jgi:hypothetical protein